MTSLFYRLYPKDAAIPDHTVTPTARWAKILANGGTLPEGEKDAAETEQAGRAGDVISLMTWMIRGYHHYRNPRQFTRGYEKIKIKTS